jgi:nicotinamidase-related amidase
MQAVTPPAVIKAPDLLTCFREKKLLIFHVQHESIKEGATFFLPETDGQKINDRVKPRENETIIVKNFPNSFIKTRLYEMLEELQIKNLVITGMMTFMCVDATRRAAKDMGFHCTLIHDATAARSLAFHGQRVAADQVKAAFLSALAMICDRIISCEEYLRWNREAYQRLLTS